MDQTERILVVRLAQALLQTNLEFTFYKKESRLGEISTAGHPGYGALKRKFAPLAADLEKSIAQEEIPAEDLYKLLQEVLKATDTLQQS